MLNFFSDFGKNNRLLLIKKNFDKFNSCKIIKKDKIESLGLSEYVVKKFSGKETPKQYSEIDNEGLLEYLTSRIPDKSIGVGTQIKAEKEYLGYITYKNPKMDGYYAVIDYTVYQDPCRPYFTLYSLSTGESVGCKINDRKLYQSNPFGEYSIIYKSDFVKDNENKWTTLERYDVVKR